MAYFVLVGGEHSIIVFCFAASLRECFLSINLQRQCMHTYVTMQANDNSMLSKQTSLFDADKNLKSISEHDIFYNFKTTINL